MRERAAEDHRAAAVDLVGELGLAQHHAAARAAQRLVGGGGDDVRVRTGSKSPVKTLPATRPAKCAMSTMKVAPTSSAISRMMRKLTLRGYAE